MRAIRGMPRPKYGHLLAGADVRRWHDNVGRGSKLTADIYLRRLGNFCKAKYCHPVFDDERVKRRCEEIFRETAGRYGMEIRELGFDRDHVHITVDAGPNHSPASMAKALKGNSGHRLLREFPHIKRRYFWGSGFWSPAYYFDSVGDRTSGEIDEYVRNQGKREKKPDAGQRTLMEFS